MRIIKAGIRDTGHATWPHIAWVEWDSGEVASVAHQTYGAAGARAWGALVAESTPLMLANEGWALCAPEDLKLRED